MFKLLILTALLAAGSTYGASDVDTFTGEWIATELWPERDSVVEAICNHFKIESLDMATKCDDKDVSLVRFSYGESIVAPAVVVQTDDEVADALKTTCEEYGGFYLFRKLNENFFTLTLSEREPNGHVTVLFAKSAPTKAELAEFVSKTAGLKEEPGSVICTKEQYSNKSAKRTSEKHNLSSFFSNKKH